MLKFGARDTNLENFGKNIRILLLKNVFLT